MSGTVTVHLPGIVEGRGRAIQARVVVPGLCVHRLETRQGESLRAWTITHYGSMKAVWNVADEDLGVALAVALGDLGDWRCLSPELLEAGRSLLSELSGIDLLMKAATR